MLAGATPSARSPSLFSLRPRFWRASASLLVSAVALAGEPAPSSPAAKAPSEKFTLSELLPLALQKNPRLYFMVSTEVSEAGKKLPEVTPEHPAFFQLRSSGYREIGDTPAGEKTVKGEEIEPVLLKSLASRGYYPAQPGQTPSLLIVYRWGTHNVIDPDNPDPTLRVRNQLDRAAMVAGEKFAGELAKVYREQAVFNLTSGGLPPEVRAFVSPINLFKMSDSKNSLLVERAGDDIYYIVASAYDYASMNEGRPVHLWRTRVTVPSQGVTQEQTLPTMIVTAGPFFGKETDRADLVTRRTIPKGKVELGTPTVVEPSAPVPQPPVETTK